MAKPRSPEPLKLITINIFASDYEKLGELFPINGKQVAIRHIIHKAVLDLEKERKND